MAAARVRRDATGARPRNDVYTWLLLISLAAMIAGCVFLYLDYSQYEGKKPDFPPPVSPLQAPAAQGGAGEAG